MKILVTGSSGFLGKIIVDTLKGQHEVQGLSRESRADYVCDIGTEVPVLPRYDIVVHAAGKAHSLPKTKEEEQTFYQVNHRGTQHLLKALDNQVPKLFVFISTVAVYGREEGKELTEDIALDAHSPYGRSKIMAEEEVLRFGKEKQCAVIILRLPLVVGKNPPGNLGSMIKAITRGYYFRIGKGSSQRSMVLAEDVARLIPSLRHKQGIYNLCAQEQVSYATLEDMIASHVQKKIRSLPLSLLRALAKIGNLIPGSPLTTYRLQKLTATLTFSDAKARRDLQWQPRGIRAEDFLS